MRTQVIGSIGKDGPLNVGSMLAAQFELKG